MAAPIELVWCNFSTGALKRVVALHYGPKRMHFPPEGSRAEIVPGVLQHLRASVEYQAQGTHATSLAIVRRATSVAIVGGAVTDGRSDKHESDLVRTTAQNWFASW